MRSLRAAFVLLFVTLSIARALEPCHGPGTIVRISSRCVQRCAFCLHAGASMLSDIAICCVVQRSGHAARALSLRGVFFGLWALPHAGCCVVWSLQCMVRAGVLVWPREGSNFWSRWTSDGDLLSLKLLIFCFYESAHRTDAICMYMYGRASALSETSFA